MDQLRQIVKAEPDCLRAWDLMAENFEEALELYNKYRSNVIGVISDVRFPKNGKLDADAGFDFAKLEDLNGQYIRKTADSELIRHIQVMLGDLEEGSELKEKFAAIGWDTVENLMPQLKERAKTLVELVDNARFLIAERPLPLDEKAAKLLDGDARAHLGLHVLGDDVQADVREDEVPDVLAELPARHHLERDPQGGAGARQLSGVGEWRQILLENPKTHLLSLGAAL